MISARLSYESSCHFFFTRHPQFHFFIFRQQLLCTYDVIIKNSLSICRDFFSSHFLFFQATSSLSPNGSALRKSLAQRSLSVSSLDTDFQLLPESTVGVNNRFCLVHASLGDLPLTLAVVRAPPSSSNQQPDLMEREILAIIDRDCPVEDLPRQLRKWWSGSVVRRGMYVRTYVCIPISTWRPSLTLA